MVGRLIVTATGENGRGTGQAGGHSELGVAQGREPCDKGGMGKPPAVGAASGGRAPPTDAAFEHHLLEAASSALCTEGHWGHRGTVFLPPTVALRCSVPSPKARPAPAHHSDSVVQQ